jgi:hypothetical protein
MDRPNLKLPRVPPDLLLSSHDDESGDVWRIEYELTLDDAEGIVFTVSETDVSLRVGQKRRACEAAGRAGEFDFAEARREVADDIVVPRILEALEARPVR